MHTHQSEISFKFKYVQNGQTQGFFSQKGRVNLQEIVLGQESLRYDDITDSTTRDRRLVLAIAPNTQLGPQISRQLVNHSIIVLEIYHANSKDLEKFIDRISSQKAVERKREQLIQAGQEHLFHAVTCPECQATVDLSELNRTSYVYCRFCESVFQENRPAVTKGASYCICDECHMFDRVMGYTEFYFYFLLIVYGFSYKRRYLCDNCANAVFWKTFLLNFIFVLGIPSSIWIKIKSMMGREPGLKQLPKANALAKKGNYQKAGAIYSQLYDRYSEHPGLLMNEGLGHLFGNDAVGAIHCFERSLRSCSNYDPVIRLIQQIQAASQPKSE